MTLIKKNGNGNNKLFPFGTGSFFGNRFFTPSLFSSDLDQWDEAFKTPLANVTETDKEFRVDLSAPGLKREDFKVEVDNGMLNISCEKEEEKNENKENYTRREFSYESFNRSFQMPENVTEDKINAKYENGMLKVSIPKKEGATTKNKKAIPVN